MGIVCTPSFLFAWGWGGEVGVVEPPTKFSEKGGGLDRTSVFREGCLKREELLFQGMGLQFLDEKMN